MSRRVVFACLVALFAAAVTADSLIAQGAGAPVSAQALPQQPSQSAPAIAETGATFRTGTEIVVLNVTVTDKEGRYIRGLSKNDFAVFEDGVAQEVSFFAASDVPLDLAILLDTSASMGEKMPLVHEAAVGFAHTLRPIDRAAIVGFDNQVQMLTSFTNDVPALEKAIRRTRAHGGTSLYTALYIALEEFRKDAKERQNNEVRRPAIVVLTDGEDTASLVSFDDVMDAAKRAGVSIYPISITSKYEAKKLEASGDRRFFNQADYGLKALAQETGARAFFPLDIKELDGVYGQIAEELSLQYSLGYAPRNTRQDGSFRKIAVQVLSRPDARPRTRSGYFAAHPINAMLGGTDR